MSDSYVFAVLWISDQSSEAACQEELLNWFVRIVRHGEGGAGEVEVAGVGVGV